MSTDMKVLHTHDSMQTDLNTCAANQKRYTTKYCQ